MLLCAAWHDLVTTALLTYHYLGQHSLSSTVSGHSIDGSDNGTHLAKCIDASDVMYNILPLPRAPIPISLSFFSPSAGFVFVDVDLARSLVYANRKG